MKLLVILLVLPMALAGDFAAMWAQVEKEMQASKGCGEGGCGMDGGMGGIMDGVDMPNDMGEDDWGTDQMGQNMEEQQKQMGWGGDQMGWGSEQMGWGGEQQQQGWGTAMMQQGWGEMQAQTGWGEAPKQSMYDEFKGWMAEQEKKKKLTEEYKAHMMENMMKFKEFMKMKKMKEEHELQEKAAIKKQMEKIMMKKMLTEKMINMSEEFAHQKMKFKYSVAAHFLEFCQCDKSKNVLQRIHDGVFGNIEGAGMDMDEWGLMNWHGMWNGTMGNGTMGNGTMGNGTIGNNTNGRNSTGMSGMGSDLMNMSPEKRRELIVWFSKLDHEMQLKHVLYDLVNVMCSAASHYFSMMNLVEEGLIEYKRNGMKWK